MSSPYEGFQTFVDQLPEFLQPLLVALLGMIPYVEGEGSAAIGILGGIHPVVAALAGIAGNLLSVVLVVLLGSRVRESVVARRAAKTAVASTGPHTTKTSTMVMERPTATDADTERDSRRAKGRRRLQRWLVRFGVPGASIIAPFALPTQLTAAFFVASGVKKGWVILWQGVAIVLWTALVAAAALGVVNLFGWQ
ncbi:small multidrug efflux protein [Microbacterium invictum]|uniref:Small multidrug efflux protein n=1 Tax=Microbacterium invictum TaxID=515415 RepID=A0ABZ0VA06_9MICO|nr:small multidrug efflux protein [Microbacterium invictum]WQB70448.1 small multidrug efflux protein [Microbacterium invictum]